ncbi:MAG: ABC transporter ATP-binding protein [Phycisphaerales bacterium]|nr:ABC transporter ATP-binding protein [Phycisphaerales bacterium]
MTDFWRLVRTMIATHRGTFVWAWVFAFISASGVGVGLFAFGPVIKLILDDGGRTLADLAQGYNAGNPVIAVPAWLISRLPTDRFEGVALIVGALGLLTLVGAIANFLHQYLSMTLCTRAVADLRQRAFRHIIALPLTTVIARGPSEFISRIMRDTVELQRGLISLTSKAIAQLTKGAVALVVAFAYDYRLSLIAIVVAPILAAALKKIGTRIRRGTRSALKSQEGLLRVATETIGGLRAVKACTGESDAAARFAVINEDVVREELKVRTARAMSPPIVETLAVFAIAALCLVAAKQIIDGHLEFTQFLVVLTALGVAGASFRPLAGLINEIQASSAPAQRLLDVLDLEVESSGPARPALPRHATSIEFRDVVFRYPGSDQPALDGVTLAVRHGQRIAVVGPNGCGKTTLIGLLPRLHVPAAGAVLIDGVDLATVDLPSLRQQIGVVTQDTVLFQGSIADNIAYGVEGATRAQIVDAARKAHADRFINEISGAYDADLAEFGSSLSGGQRQRLAIARAILRDPSILILDEATSQIDAESEEQINLALAEFCAGRTAIIVAHRLSTVLHADVIVVMDAGRIVDHGTHVELLERCPLYQRLTNTQLVAAT